MGFIKSFYSFKNFKFELVENRSKDRFESILENKDQALSVLRKNGVSESEPAFISLRSEIEKKFKNLNYLGLMTKYIFEQEISFQEVKDLLTWLKFNGGRLPKNPLEYKEFEDIKDATIKVDNNQRVKVIYNLLPSEQKKLAKHNPPFFEKALEIHRLGMIKEFGRKLSAQKTKEELINYMNLFIETNAKKITFDKIVKDLRDLNSDILIEDPDTGIVMAEILDYNTSKKTGSPDWCIVTGESSWDSYTKGTKRQFFLWDFSEERTSSLFMVGFTTNNIGQITNIHDKYDVSLRGSIPVKIKTSLKSIDLSTDPFEYKDKIMSNISKGLASEIEYPDENVIILRVKKEGFKSFQSEGWGHYSPFPYGDDVPNFYFYVIYNFKYPLNDDKFCYGIESSDDGELVLVNIIGNLGDRGFIAKKNGKEDVKIEGNLDSEFLTDLYVNGYIKPKDIEDILSEKKENYLNKIEKYVKGSEEISRSYVDKKSVFINTSDDEGSTGSKWLFKIENDELDKFDNGIIDKWNPNRYDNIHDFNLYCLIDLDESFRSPTFLRFIKLSESNITVVHNMKGNKSIYKNVYELSEDLQEFIESGYMIIKSKSDYNKEVSEQKRKIFSKADSDYDDDDDVDESGKALFDFLLTNGDLDEDDYEGDEDPYKRVLIPSYSKDMKEFDLFSHKMVISGQVDMSWIIGSDEQADSAQIERMESLIDDIGYHDAQYYINGEEFADYILQDEESYIRDMISEDPQHYDISKIMKDGVEEELEEFNTELEKLQSNETKAESRLEKYEEFIESKKEKVESLLAEIEDNDPNFKTNKRFIKLSTILNKLKERFDINLTRYSELIEKIQDRISEVEDEISNREDEDDEDYWEYDESEYDEKAEEYYNYKYEEVKNDPTGYLDEMGYEKESKSYKELVERFIDKDEYIKDQVSNYDRGEDLASYDGVEHNHTYNGNDYYIYRTQ